MSNEDYGKADNVADKAGRSYTREARDKEIEDAFNTELMSSSELEDRAARLENERMAGAAGEESESAYDAGAMEYSRHPSKSSYASKTPSEVLSDRQMSGVRQTDAKLMAEVTSDFGIDEVADASDKKRIKSRNVFNALVKTAEKNPTGVILGTATAAGALAWLAAKPTIFKYLVGAAFTLVQSSLKRQPALNLKSTAVSH